jgi:thymidylate kinase
MGGAAFVRDYSDHVGGGRRLPPPLPGSLDDEERALIRFLDIEAERTTAARAGQQRITLIDRSVHTLMAHCFAVELMTGVAYAKLANNILSRSTIPLWPDIVVYLDIPNHDMTLRNKGKFPVGSLFMEPSFNLGIKSYFQNLLRDKSPPVVLWFDAAADRRTLHDQAAAALQNSLEMYPHRECDQ